MTEKTRWLDAEQQGSWRALLLGMTLLLDRLDDDLRDDFDISLGEYEVLVRLSENDGQMRMANLADALAHSRSRVTHTITRMEKSGWVRRTQTAEDGRGVVARITPEGMAMLRAAAPSHVASVRAHLVDLAAPEDLAALGRVMNSVADDLIAIHPHMEMR